MLEIPKIWEMLGPTPCDGGVADPLETRFSPPVTVPNLVILGETIECNYGDLPEKIDPLCSAF